jgi:hypothetical protein
MIAEAPLWGSQEKYVYNPETNNSQFFYRSDLGNALGKNITNKKDFLKICNEIGLLVIDISPFAFNSADTKVNYKLLTLKEYRLLISSTIPSYFEKKITLLRFKKAIDIQVFFRYSRVKKAFQQLIAPILINHGLISRATNIADISQSGGGINKEELKRILRRTSD